MRGLIVSCWRYRLDNAVPPKLLAETLEKLEHALQNTVLQDMQQRKSSLVTTRYKRRSLYVGYYELYHNSIWNIKMRDLGNTSQLMAHANDRYQQPIVPEQLARQIRTLRKLNPCVIQKHQSRRRKIGRTNSTSASAAWDLALQNNPRYQRNLRYVTKAIGRNLLIWIAVLAIFLGMGRILQATRANYYQMVPDDEKQSAFQRLDEDEIQGVLLQDVKPTWLPDGFKMVKEEVYLRSILRTYRNKDMYVTINLTSAEGMGRVDVEEGIYEKVKIGPIMADLMIKNSRIYIVWLYKDTAIRIDSNLSKEDIIRIAQFMEEGK